MAGLGVEVEFENKHRRSCLASGRLVSGWGLVTHGAMVPSPMAFIPRQAVGKLPTRPEGRWLAPSVHHISTISSSGFSASQAHSPLVAVSTSTTTATVAPAAANATAGAAATRAPTAAAAAAAPTSDAAASSPTAAVTVASAAEAAAAVDNPLQPTSKISGTRLWLLM